MMINHLYHHRTAAFWRIRYNTLTIKHYFLLPQLLLHVYTRVLLSSSITGALFWAMTFYCWYKVIGYFFVPLGIYFTSLVSPAFVRRSEKNGARETVIEESSGSTHLSAFAKREENAAKSVNEDVYRREHAEQVGEQRVVAEARGDLQVEPAVLH